MLLPYSYTFFLFTPLLPPRTREMRITLRSVSLRRERFFRIAFMKNANNGMYRARIFTRMLNLSTRNAGWEEGGGVREVGVKRLLSFAFTQFHRFISTHIPSAIYNRFYNSRYSIITFSIFFVVHSMLCDFAALPHVEPSFAIVRTHYYFFIYFVKSSNPWNEWMQIERFSNQHHKKEIISNRKVVDFHAIRIKCLAHLSWGDNKGWNLRNLQAKTIPQYFG